MDARWNGVRRRLLAAACVVVVAVATASPAGALSLDEEQNFSLRMHAYTQLTLSMQDSQRYVTSPEKFTGQMMQNRTFLNPELEAKFTSFLPPGWLDELSGRLALWGFYDGLYDYGPDQYAQAAADIKFHRGPNGAYQTKGDTREQASPHTVPPNVHRKPPSRLVRSASRAAVSGGATRSRGRATCRIVAAC